MICDELPKSCLVKQKRTDLNKIFTIQPVPGQYPGAKLFLRDIDSTCEVKITDGAKMTRSNNFMILFFKPSSNRRKGNRIIAAVNGPEK